MTRRDLTAFLTAPFKKRRPAPRPPLPEHSVVKLASKLTLDDGRILPSGAKGAIVGIWADGAAYEVEFSEPFHAVVTVSGPNLSLARKAS